MKEKKIVSFKLKYTDSGLQIGAVKQKYFGRDPQNIREKIYEDDEMPWKVLKFDRGYAWFIESEDYCNRITGEMITAEQFVPVIYEQNKKLFRDGTISIVEDRHSRDIMKKLGLQVRHTDELVELAPSNKNPISQGIQTSDKSKLKEKFEGRAAIQEARLKKAEEDEKQEAKI